MISSRHLRMIALSLLSTVGCSIHCLADETRSFVAADSSRKRIAIVDESGQTKWEHKIGPLHDLHVLPNGNVLFQDSWTHVLEVNPATDEIIWDYEARKAPGNEGKRIEIHAFQRLDNGNTMVVESGTSRILELDSQNKVLVEIPLKVSKPDAHRDTRLVRKLTNGNYLVCHEGDGLVREYNSQGQTVWEFAVPLFGRQPSPGHGVDAFGNQCFTALRLANGNTLIATGNGHGIIEVTPAGQDVWSVHQNDLPGIQLAWVTSLQVLPNGNILINNCHAGPENPQLIEIDRQKRVVWTFRDFDRFGDSTTNSQILTSNGKPVRGIR
ncbi:MAG: PQQ-binding-like beta-propeller repeat protein [Planctomycetaceae bacterium]